MAACEELEASTATTYDKDDFIFDGSLEVSIIIFVFLHRMGPHNGFFFGREGAEADG